MIQLHHHHHHLYQLSYHLYNYYKAFYSSRNNTKVQETDRWKCDSVDKIGASNQSEEEQEE
ncbi:hypothetical protein DFA_10106 [Cavenderia fasciculata]|uniref:Uncharacterized protein n=1 Tax=Cavenderia fasciculata TaxID=261658 RepID=F4Q9A3_CACFS|nr:uncharacterized protein DFA_10106 [Cavenderia fasciculata]EGG15272.1 hypothetical protein DFA_10106 [Cavenderia fasciculata]|eukprot:XP_004351992.1 hypothetical protein DFA_10106 [Cavenderia fasciculata]